MNDLEARDSQGKAKALSILTNTIAIGEARQSSIIQSALKRVIVDKLVEPSLTSVNADNDKIYLCYANSGEDHNALFPVSNHAIGQMCNVAGIPKTYINKLMSECVGMSEVPRMALVDYIFNTHFREGVYKDRKGLPAKFLHRLMNGELVGFLSRNYNRKLGTVAMMRPFIEQCTKHGARPVEAVHSTLKTSLKCVLPTVYEPIDGEFVAFGATYTNSDFGAGSLTVNSVVLRISSGSSSVLEGKMKKVHLGAMITDSDIELSENTMNLESKTHQAAVRDMVDVAFSEETIRNTIETVKFAAERKLPWDKLVSKAKEILNKAELDKLYALLGESRKGVIDLPPVTVNDLGDPEANAWWASAALGTLASDIQNVERKLEIQELAGSLLLK